jgi:uncharacterized membrane protein
MPNIPEMGRFWSAVGFCTPMDRRPFRSALQEAPQTICANIDRAKVTTLIAAPIVDGQISDPLSSPRDAEITCGHACTPFFLPSGLYFT